MERNPRLLIGWKKGAAACGFAFALLVVLLDSFPLDLSGRFQPLVSTFLQSLKTQLLPQGWFLLGLDSSTKFEIDAIASLALAFLIIYPIAAYWVISLISANSMSKKSFIALVAGAVGLFYAGAAFGTYQSYQYIMGSAPNTIMPGVTTQIAGYNFYSIALYGIVSWALAFTAPAYLIAAEVRARKMR